MTLRADSQRTDGSSGQELEMKREVILPQNTVHNSLRRHRGVSAPLAFPHLLAVTMSAPHSEPLSISAAEGHGLSPSPKGDGSSRPAATFAVPSPRLS